jgi:hypothetical protein
MDPIAVLAVIVAPVAAVAGVAVTLDHQRRQSASEDKRHLRDARHARARQALGKLVALTLKMELVADQPLLTTPAMREALAKLLEQIGYSWPEMLSARAEILCEPDGERWMSEFEAHVLQPFKAVREAAQQDEDPREPLKALKAGVARFRALVAAHLADLERPV